MPGLMDLGQGLKMYDASQTIDTAIDLQKLALAKRSASMDAEKTQLEIQNLKNKVADAPYQSEKLRWEASQKKADAVKHYTEAFKAVSLFAAQGNEGAATALIGELVPQWKNKVGVTQSRDPMKAAAGVVDVVNIETGELLYSQDPFMEQKVTKNIDTKAALVKKRNELGLTRIVNREKEVLDIAKSFSKDTGESLQDSVAVAQSLVEMTTSQDAEAVLGPGYSGKLAPIGSLDAETISGVIGKKELVKEATKRSVSNVSLRAKSDLSPAQSDAFASALEGIQQVSGRLIPVFSLMTKEDSILSRPGLIGGSIQSLRSRFKVSDPEFEVLRSFSEQTQWNKLVEIAGTTFTERVKTEIQKLVPSEKDPLDLAMAKGAAFLASMISLSQNKLDVWETTGKYTGQLRSLLNPESDSRFAVAASAEILGNITEDRKERLSETILSNLPTEVKDDSKVMDMFIRAMPGPLKSSLVKQLAAQGRAPIQNSVDMAAQALGITE